MYLDAEVAVDGDRYTDGPICRSKDHDGDTDMAEESKQAQMHAD